MYLVVARTNLDDLPLLLTADKAAATALAKDVDDAMSKEDGTHPAYDHAFKAIGPWGGEAGWINTDVWEFGADGRLKIKRRRKAATGVPS